ncbi:GGDEF domain-containing protein [Erwinia sp. OLTSP20]|uniref:GGDEF domain-containing protein n=1 Tax=unclassified Erwinia TaxID=2622719 RepID=UPI000C1997BA|nr:MULTISPECIES: GGDEF domain-containing protein [unclassified Erwinia]PIJ48887.1 GGDEF domain-containing protein [Erwinia sp. OAMSP11]PIJ74540.1 GGDEF domain-containing protein [Erwinia sp. OLSSP12]PIJ79571.1 GGDEF domain-containing protein [Erwinia sp. OLCASP19]PIJ80356.1 GGDEF domain-containing protein [Erwinia sp. OLMTSP26]PIJ82471.1 GGDEF domain-containing protein [Erwinia sp. OLMDSP33]
MNLDELFTEENFILDTSRDIAEQTRLDAEVYRQALLTLNGHYQRLIRESYRLIARSDRAERELTLLNAQLQRLAEKLEYEATHDALTGVYNRNAIISRISTTLQQSDAALILLDIDHFKNINDRFGHPRGDAVLQELIKRIECTLPGLASIGRVGGEEFTILLPATSLEAAVIIASTIHAALNVAPLVALPGQLVTASFGLSWGARHSCFEELYAQADRALYQAKRDGRNRLRWG